MYKDELISLHQLLSYIARFLEKGGVPSSYFEDYAKLEIGPHHIQGRKEEHRYAVFVLSECISKALVDQGVVPRGIAGKLGEMAESHRKTH